MPFEVKTIPATEVDALLAYAGTLYGIVEARIIPASEAFTSSEVDEPTCMLKLTPPVYRTRPDKTTASLMDLMNTCERYSVLSDRSESEMNATIRAQMMLYRLEGEEEVHANIMILRVVYDLGVLGTHRLAMVGCAGCAREALQSMATCGNFAALEMGAYQEHTSVIGLHDDQSAALREWLASLAPLPGTGSMEAGRPSMELPQPTRERAN